MTAWAWVALDDHLGGRTVVRRGGALKAEGYRPVTQPVTGR